eukprot:CAMPEP_0177792078 /NCGR_PEP_ID=MMETSP0491_2-20121128/24316_1 /TAXON_ID=63592 /ORGANISM="Tetraselmis chuii, Strain PLY429" /LENGTH=49 /DNA_ID=CAMNT_0019314435 /DNA_START=1 /DNA_END=150 /DNA_ORIENTATION=+
MGNRTPRERRQARHDVANSNSLSPRGSAKDMSSDVLESAVEGLLEENGH